jgi:hypothetical protein
MQENVRKQCLLAIAASFRKWSRLLKKKAAPSSKRKFGSRFAEVAAHR